MPFFLVKWVSIETLGKTFEAAFYSEKLVKTRKYISFGELKFAVDVNELDDEMTVNLRAQEGDFAESDELKLLVTRSGQIVDFKSLNPSLHRISWRFPGYLTGDAYTLITYRRGSKFPYETVEWRAEAPPIFDLFDAVYPILYPEDKD